MTQFKQKDPSTLYNQVPILSAFVVFCTTSRRSLVRFSDVVLLFGGASTFVGVVVRLCDPFLPFPSVLGSLLDTTAAIAQPKFFLCLCHFVGLSELSEYTSVTSQRAPSSLLRCFTWWRWRYPTRHRSTPSDTQYTPTALCSRPLMYT